MHGRRSRGGDKSPRIWSGGDANVPQIPRFCHIGTKMSVLWPSKYPKIRFRPGLCLGPRCGSSRRSPRPFSRLERGHPSHTPPHSARTHLQRSPYVPQKSSQIYAMVIVSVGLSTIKLSTVVCILLHNLQQI